MFDAYGGLRARRPCDPPRPVRVKLGVLWPPTRLRWGAETPIWVRSAGVPVDETVPGVLSEWVLTSVGDWLGRCTFTVTVDGQPMEFSTWVPKAALAADEP